LWGHWRGLLYWLVGLLIFGLVAATSELITHLMVTSQLERQRSETVNKVATLRARLEGEINSTLHLTRGLIAFVATHPELDEREFTLLASEIVHAGRSIRNIGLARDNVIFPLAGNEAALGMDYAKMPAQWRAVKKAMDLKGTVVAGPVNLVQGGRAFIARTPVYTRFGMSGILDKHKPQYWGMASIVIDIQPLFQAAGLLGMPEGLAFALRGADGRGQNGGMILGDESLFSRSPVLQTVMLPNGSWQIAATPQGGWVGMNNVTLLLRVLGWVMGLVIGALTVALLRARAVSRSLALHDHLTGLPNRRLLEDRLDQLVARANRDASKFGLIYMDLDGFKLINDDLGHKVGDALLVEVSRRMQRSVRAMDTVARVGGDEFVILVDRVASRAELEKLRQHLKERLLGTALIDGHKLVVCASMGVAVCPDDGLTVDDLLKKGDGEMYADKHRSKVRVLKSGKRA
jgi:diguanylate cyclase (GGDEF)-like protein